MAIICGAYNVADEQPKQETDYERLGLRPANKVYIDCDGEVTINTPYFDSHGKPVRCPNCRNKLVFLDDAGIYFCANMWCGYKEEIMLRQLTKLEIILPADAEEYILTNALRYDYDLTFFLIEGITFDHPMEAMLAKQIKKRFQSGIFPSDVCKLIRVPDSLADYYKTFDSIFSSLETWLITSSDIEYCRKTIPAFDYTKQIVIARYIEANKEYCTKLTRY